jgi:surfactin synthase thioesterase subunit
MTTTTLTDAATRPITRLSTSHRSPTAHKSVRLICFHHAGGGATSFNLWKRGIGSDVEVVAVEIPNRERFATLRDLVDEMNTALGSTLDEPHIFFGHSFGALVAYRLACVRAAAGLPQPTALILSSFTPPHLPTSIPMVDEVDDQQLGKILSDIGGLPVELTRWPTLREKAVALARIDLRLCSTDDDADSVPLTSPIHVFGGSEDILVSESDLSQWRSRTLAEFSMQMLKGGHFHVSDRKQLFAALRPVLSEVGSARAKVA